MSFPSCHEAVTPLLFTFLGGCTTPNSAYKRQHPLQVSSTQSGGRSRGPWRNRAVEVLRNVAPVAQRAHRSGREEVTPSPPADTAAANSSCLLLGIKKQPLTGLRGGLCATKPHFVFRPSPAAAPHASCQTWAQRYVPVFLRGNTTEQCHGTARYYSLSAARANTYFLGLSLRFVVHRHRKCRFRALGQDEKRRRTQCKTTRCCCTDTDLSCH